MLRPGHCHIHNPTYDYSGRVSRFMGSQGFRGLRVAKFRAERAPDT